MNDVFREEQIQIDDCGQRRRQLMDLENAIDDTSRRREKCRTSWGSTLKSSGKLASTQEFKEALQLAKDQPDSSRAIKLNAVLLRLLSLVARTVLFSPYEGSATRPKLGAMRYKYGVGQHWVTIAPPEHDDLLLHRTAQLRHKKRFYDESSPFTLKACGFSDLPRDLQKSARARLKISNAYPALAAQVFERKVRVFTQALLRCGDSSSTRVSRNNSEREQGVYGRVAGFNAAVEPRLTADYIFMQLFTEQR
ncbi:hypothetical protein PInf_023474 [Phytophthora infestans]|nr:hypothetical protein PInf_023474 [Phytophthora infestans]